MPEAEAEYWRLEAETRLCEAKAEAEAYDNLLHVLKMANKKLRKIAIKY